jgi:hypothetical protein
MQKTTTNSESLDEYRRSLNVGKKVKKQNAKLFRGLFWLIAGLISIFFSLQQKADVSLIGDRLYHVNSVEYEDVELFVGGNGILRTCNPLRSIQGIADSRCNELFPVDREALRNILATANTCSLKENYRFRIYARLGSSLLESLNNSFECQPQLIGSVDYYPNSFSRVTTVRTSFFRTEIRRSYIDGRMDLYVLPRNSEDGLDESRYFVFATNFEDEMELVWASDKSDIDWGWVAPVRVFEPLTRADRQRAALPVGDPRWTDTAIALSRAGASGCGEFYVSAQGLVYCWDSKASWQIDFSSQQAIRR